MTGRFGDANGSALGAGSPDPGALLGAGLLSRPRIDGSPGPLTNEMLMCGQPGGGGETLSRKGGVGSHAPTARSERKTKRPSATRGREP
jgi:hypothetical protein